MKHKQLSIVACVCRFCLFLAVEWQVRASRKRSTGAMACVNDKWDVKEPEKGHKTGRRRHALWSYPDDLAEPTISQDCAGNYAIYA